MKKKYKDMTFEEITWEIGKVKSRINHLIDRIHYLSRQMQVTGDKLYKANVKIEYLDELQNQKWREQGYEMGYGRIQDINRDEEE